MRPTPFCLLDEIDAALDDRNVERFAKYLHNLAKNTQFIVITHRRGTMEEADVLYGVTMQEQGVSRMLTINLNDVEKELKLKTEDIKSLNSAALPLPVDDTFLPLIVEACLSLNGEHCKDLDSMF